METLGIYFLTPNIAFAGTSSLIVMLVFFLLLLRAVGGFFKYHGQLRTCMLLDNLS